MIRPTVFIGSSSEGLSIAKAIQGELADCADATIWDKGIFGLGYGTLESLVNALDDFDFAILVLTPDDVIESRNSVSQAPRDNVLFECGLFMGRLGRTRTFVVYDPDSSIRIPSDLAGVTLAPCRSQGQTADPGLAITDCCKPIRDEIRRQGVFARRRVRGIELGAYSFKEVFGEDVFSPGSFHLVYAQLAPMPSIGDEGLFGRFRFVKPGDDKPKAMFSAERLIHSCEVRAAKYLAESIGAEARVSPALSSDLDMRDRLDASFVAFGGPLSNYKTEDVISNEGNQLLSFDNTYFTSARSGRVILKTSDKFDYGLILKIHPSQFRNRTWFACAGLGEWGTSGAAWVLAKRWREIQAYASDSAFAIIVRVRRGLDESAEAILRVKDESDVTALEAQFDW